MVIVFCVALFIALIKNGGGMSMNDARAKYSVYLSDDTVKLVETFYKFDSCSSKSSYIEKSIRYYTGYVSGKKSSDYLPDEVNKSVKNTMVSFENRISKLLFKISVELDMLMNVVAASINVDQDDLKRLRGQCVDEVKHTNGILDFDNAVKYQQGEINE